ncbi:hypothetical protein PV350_02960 [Streptomyces sp. PA03-6a]|nr:hypothetical protein [Streptomyces sp. PA03-6a]
MVVEAGPVPEGEALDVQGVVAADPLHQVLLAGEDAVTVVDGDGEEVLDEVGEAPRFSRMAANSSRSIGT